MHIYFGLEIHIHKNQVYLLGECYEVAVNRNIQSYVVHQELRNRFDSIWTHDNNASIIVEKVTKEKRDELNRSDPNELKRIVDTMLGFTKVFRLLIQYKKVFILIRNKFLPCLQFNCFNYSRLHCIVVSWIFYLFMKNFMNHCQSQFMNLNAKLISFFLLFTTLNMLVLNVKE